MASNIPECYISGRIEEGWKYSIRHRICDDLPAKPFSDGKSYCILHLPDDEKGVDFDIAIHNRLVANDYFFEGVYFPRPFADLWSSEIITKGMSFRFATFAEEASFLDRTYTKPVNFSGVEFKKKTVFRSTFEEKTDFSNAKFQGQADFTNAAFRGEVHFHQCTFEGKVGFILTKFEKPVFFGAVTIEEKSVLYFRFGYIEDLISFGSSIIYGRLHFEGGEYDTGRSKKNLKLFDGATSRLSFRSITVARPEQITFKKVALCPSWFVDADPRKFVFANIEWRKYAADTQLANVGHLGDARELLSTAYRDLASNYEEKNQLLQAAEFRYLALQTDRVGHRLKGWFWTWDWLYWLSSGYGEKRGRAFLVLVSIVLFFSLIFTSGLSTFDFGDNTKNAPIVAEDIIEEKIGDGATIKERFRALEISDAIVYSLSIITFRHPDPRPANVITEVWVILLTILGPVQIALFAFAIRRKFLK